MSQGLQVILQLSCMVWLIAPVLALGPCESSIMNDVEGMRQCQRLTMLVERACGLDPVTFTSRSPCLYHPRLEL